MVRLSKKAEYGLIAIRHIATRPHGDLVTAKEIADAYGIPYELLAKVLQRLTRAGLIMSVQGVRGGYALAREPQTITVSGIINAIEGSRLGIAQCMVDGAESCGVASTCTIKSPLDEGSGQHRTRVLEHDARGDRVMGHRTPIYLDAHATTPVDERVLAAMLPYFTERFGNAASKQHVYGWEAEAAVEGARTDVATLIGASPREIVFTSGATESINLALKGVAEVRTAEGGRLSPSRPNTVPCWTRAGRSSAAAGPSGSFRSTATVVSPSKSSRPPSRRGRCW